METNTQEDKVVRSFQLSRADEERLDRLARDADRSWSAEVRRAVAEHLARTEAARS